MKNKQKTKEEISEIIKGILMKHLKIEETEVTDDAKIIKDLKADDVDYDFLILDFEHQSGIKIDAHDIEKLKTVGDVIEYLYKKQN